MYKTGTCERVEMVFLIGIDRFVIKITFIITCKTIEVAAGGKGLK